MVQMVPFTNTMIGALMLWQPSGGSKCWYAHRIALSNKSASNNSNKQAKKRTIQMMKQQMAKRRQTIWTETRTRTKMDTRANTEIGVKSTSFSAIFSYHDTVHHHCRHKHIDDVHFHDHHRLEEAQKCASSRKEIDHVPKIDFPCTVPSFSLGNYYTIIPKFLYRKLSNLLF